MNSRRPGMGYGPARVPAGNAVPPAVAGTNDTPVYPALSWVTWLWHVGDSWAKAVDVTPVNKSPVAIANRFIVFAFPIRQSSDPPVAPRRSRGENLTRHSEANLHPWNIQRSEFGKSRSPSTGIFQTR